MTVQPMQNKIPSDNCTNNFHFIYSTFRRSGPIAVTIM